MTSIFGLDLAGKRVVIAGAGSVATRRATAWVADGAVVVVVAPVASVEIVTLAETGRLAWHERPVVRSDVDGAWLVLVATDSPEVNADIAAWAAEARVWCVDASAAANGSAGVAASATLGDLALGVVSLGSPDPRRVAGVRDSLVAHLASGQVDLRRQRAGTGRVILVGSGPGATDLLTLRAWRALCEADVVVADRLGAIDALEGLSESVEVIHVGKAPMDHSVPQEEINRIIVDRALAGKTVVRFKGGDPFVFGRGGEEVQACVDAGVEVEVIPGVTSAFSVPALAGIPVTHRGVSGSVLVTTGHEGADSVALAAMAGGATVVVVMGVAALPSICAAALAHGVDPQTPVAIIENGSSPVQRLTRASVATASDVAARVGVRNPAVIVIGAVARERLLGT